MVRLALAVTLILVAGAVVVTFVAGLAAVRREAGMSGRAPRMEGSTMQKVAFFLLVALILYVSASGGA